MVRDSFEVIPENSEFCLRFALGKDGVEVELEVWGEKSAECLWRSATLPLSEVHMIIHRLQGMVNLADGEVT